MRPQTFTISRWRKVGNKLFALGFVGLASVGCGKLYMHSDGLQSLAEEARTGFQQVAAKNLAGDLADQIKTDQTFAIGILRSLDDVTTDTQLDTVLSQSWNDLLTLTNGGPDDIEGNRLKEANSMKDKAEEDEKAVNKKFIEVVNAHARAKKKVTDGEQALTAAKCYQQRYEATQNLLADVIAIKFKENGDVATSAVTKILSKKVEDFEGKDGSDCKSGDTVAKLLKLEPLLDVVENAGVTNRGDAIGTIFKIVKSLPELDEKAKLALQDPGLAATIVGLGYDLARAAEQRLNSELSYWKNLQALHQVQLAFAEDWIKRLKRAEKRGFPFSLAIALEIEASLPTPEKPRTVADTLRALGRNYIAAKEAFLKAGSADVEKAKAEKSAREDLRLALVITAYSFENLYVMQSRAQEFASQAGAMETTQQAVLVESVLKEREAFISRGLEGLVAFHQSGISTEDIRGLIGLAQFAGLLAIAEGT